MSTAQGALTKIGYVPEVTYGTTPGTPSLISVPFTAFSMNLQKEVYDDMSIQADRMQRFSVHGNYKVAGDLDVNFSHANFDFMLESLLKNTFTGNTLKTGVVSPSSFSLEAGYTDIAQFSQWSGVLVDKFALKVPVNGIVTGKFSLVGKQEAALTGTSLDASYTAATARQPYVHVNGTFKEGGSTVGYMTGIDLNVDNGYQANFSLGNAYVRDWSVSFAKITGSVSAFFENATIYNKFVNATASSLDFTLTDGTNTMQFVLPNVKYSGASKPISGQGPVVISMPFTALYDSGSSTNISIVRSA